MRIVTLVFCALALVGCGHQAGHDHAHGTGDGQHAHDTAVVDPDSRVLCSSDSDEQAIAIAQGVVEKMGGWQAYDETRYLKWKFFGGRLHHWDRWTGDIRIEGKFARGDDAPEMLILMNALDKTGRAWENGEEIAEADKLKETLQAGYEAWINDSYWVVMPFKLLDPGVTLKYAGERATEDGRDADVLELTFEGVGVTPENRYEVFVARDTGLVEQWSYFSTAEEAEPGFTLPWTGWKRCGKILIATKHQNPSERTPEPADWEIEVLEDVPEALFADPGTGAATSTG